MSRGWAVAPCVSNKWHLVRMGSPLAENRAPDYPEPVQTRPTQLSVHHFSIMWWKLYQVMNLPLLFPDRNGDLPGQNMDKRGVAFRKISNNWLCFGHAYSISWSWPCVMYFLTFGLSQDQVFSLPSLLLSPSLISWCLTWEPSSYPELQFGITLGFSRSWPWIVLITAPQFWLQTVVKPAELLAAFHPMNP